MKYKGRRNPTYRVTEEEEANPFYFVDFSGRMDGGGFEMRVGE